MAQTTDGITWVDAVLEFSASVTTPSWDDLSGYATTIEPDGGERQTEETFTFAGDTPIIGVGKRAAQSYTASLVYTEGATDAYKKLYDAYLAKTKVLFRWFPKGKTNGNKVITTSPWAVITSCPPPAGEAESAETLLAEVEFICADTTQATYSGS